MTISRPTPYLSEILSSERIADDQLAYFRSRLKSRLHSFVLAQFMRIEQERKFTKADLARKLGKKPEQITRWLSAPGNWEVDTLSDLLLGMGFEPRLSAADLQFGAIGTADEDWRKSGDQLASAPAQINRIQAANDWLGGSVPNPNTDQTRQKLQGLG